jgi:hypothetical protein
MNPINDLIFSVRLMEIDLKFQVPGQRATIPLHIGERLVAVDMRLTLAKQIEVGPIEDINEATHDPSVCLRVRAWFGEEPHPHIIDDRFGRPGGLPGRRLAAQTGCALLF